MVTALTWHPVPVLPILSAKKDMFTFDALTKPEAMYLAMHADLDCPSIQDLATFCIVVFRVCSHRPSQQFGQVLLLGSSTLAPPVWLGPVTTAAMAARAASEFEGLSREELVQIAISTKQQAGPFDCHKRLLCLQSCNLHAAAAQAAEGVVQFHVLRLAVAA